MTLIMGIVTTSLVFADECGCISTECASRGLGCAMALDCGLGTAVLVGTIGTVVNMHTKGDEYSNTYDAEPEYETREILWRT